ncbi:MAG: hypothetical protein AB7P03_01410 [Kofleriaceae bacterium]
MSAGVGAGQAGAPAPGAPKVPSASEGYDFTEVGRALFAVGACGGTIPPQYDQDVVEKHCRQVDQVQDDYRAKWVTRARAFFAQHVPANVPKVVVYPFAGGDLSTALTVYPDADEITTMSLEPAGDPRTLAAMIQATPSAPSKTAKPVKRGNPALGRALATVHKELRFLYRVNFSNTLNMIEAMRGGALPTQLIFGLSALKVHGYEVVGLRYFKLDETGAIKYLTAEDVAAAPALGSGKNQARNEVFANAELRFRKPGGRVQVYRHIQVNLDNAHLTKDPRVLKHLESKGTVAGMTKAASYLLSWPGFSMMRDYLTSHVAWMVSDATGVAPKWGRPAGYEYETYGGFVAPHISAGDGIAADWRREFASQPRRPLGFRFGYYDNNLVNHLVVMRKK